MAVRVLQVALDHLDVPGALGDGGFQLRPDRRLLAVRVELLLQVADKGLQVAATLLQALHLGLGIAALAPGLLDLLAQVTAEGAHLVELSAILLTGHGQLAQGCQHGRMTLQLRRFHIAPQLALPDPRQQRLQLPHPMIVPEKHQCTPFGSEKHRVDRIVPVTSCIRVPGT